MTTTTVQRPPLRNYQQACKTGVRDAFRAGHKRVLAVLSTGGGKTNIASDMIADAMARDWPCLFIAHRRELITQARDRMLQFGLKAGVIMGSDTAEEPLLNVASVQTLVRRMDRLPKARLIIVDEAHRFILELTLKDEELTEAQLEDVADENDMKPAELKTLLTMYGKVFRAYAEDTYWIGLTATPVRLDGKPLNAVFQTMVIPEVDGVPVDIKWLQENGFLVRTRYFAGREKPDLSQVAKSKGDFQKKALFGAIDQKVLYADAVKVWKARARNKRTVAFCLTVKHAERMAGEFVAAGYKAEIVHGAMNKLQRDAILRRFRSGETMLLMNVGILTEGYDLPDIECVAVYRPTDSLALWLQMIGRGLRPIYAPGMALNGPDERILAIEHSAKQECIVLDHGSNCDRLLFAETTREWTLDGADKKSKKGLKAVTECDELAGGCGAIWPGYPLTCPNCGMELNTPGEKEEKEAKANGTFVELLPGHLNKLLSQMSIPELDEYRAFKKLKLKFVLYQLRLRANGDSEAYLALLEEFAAFKQYKPGWVQMQNVEF